MSTDDEIPCACIHVFDDYRIETDCPRHGLPAARKRFLDARDRVRAETRARDAVLAAARAVAEVWPEFSQRICEEIPGCGTGTHPAMLAISALSAAVTELKKAQS